MIKLLNILAEIKFVNKMTPRMVWNLFLEIDDEFNTEGGQNLYNRYYHSLGNFLEMGDDYTDEDFRLKIFSLDSDKLNSTYQKMKQFQLTKNINEIKFVNRITSDVVGSLFTELYRIYWSLKNDEEIEFSRKFMAVCKKWNIYGKVPKDIIEIIDLKLDQNLLNQFYLDLKEAQKLLP